MPLMVACLFQTLYEKVIVGFQQATQPQSPFLTVKAGLAYFKDRYPAVMQVSVREPANIKEPSEWEALIDRELLLIM